MKINSIALENFRCFKQYEISFAEKTTVLFGKNGTGKTTLMNSIKTAMSFVFSKYKDKNEKLELLGNTPDLHLANLSKTDAFIDSSTKFYSYPITIECKANINNNEFDWAIVKNSADGRLLETRYRDAFLDFTRSYNADLKNSKLPIFAFFSDSYPHKKINIGSYAKSVLKSGIIPRAFAYYQWDAEANCAEIWQNRYISQYSKINDFKNSEEDTLKERKEIAFIDERLKLFTSALNPNFEFINSELTIHKVVLERPLREENAISIKFLFQDKREIFFEHLPQGYNRLLSIVFDIAYRSYVLNGEQEPQGVVLIDEIELHLHPSLQQEVIQRFKKTFPNMQFIISTHSPLVISNLKADGLENKIVKLKNAGTEYWNEDIENVFGIDYTTSLMEVMGAKYRASTIDNLIDSIVILASRNRVDDAEKLKNELSAIVGENNHYIQKEIESRIEMNKK